jgi:radical SAM protein with 4Fe4S-binding SPASM domain
MRTGLKYDVVSKNIRNLAAIKKGLQKTTPKVILNVVFSPKYQKYVSEFEKNWNPYVDHINFQKEHNWTLTHSSQELPTICNTFWNNMTVLWDGKVTFCCLDWNGQHLLGDVNKNTLFEIWNNEAYTALRKNALKGNIKSIPLCKNCSLLEDDDVYLNFIKFHAVNLLR